MLIAMQILKNLLAHFNAEENRLQTADHECKYCNLNMKHVSYDTMCAGYAETKDLVSIGDKNARYRIHQCSVILHLYI